MRIAPNGFKVTKLQATSTGLCFGAVETSKEGRLRLKGGVVELRYHTLIIHRLSTLGTQSRAQPVIALMSLPRTDLKSRSAALIEGAAGPRKQARTRKQASERRRRVAREARSPARLQTHT